MIYHLITMSLPSIKLKRRYADVRAEVILGTYDIPVGKTLLHQELYMTHQHVAMQDGTMRQAMNCHRFIVRPSLYSV